MNDDDDLRALFKQVDAEGDLPGLDQALTALVFASDWDAYQEALREHQALLLSDEGLAALDGLIELFPQMGGAQALPTMQQHRRLLQRCRAIGLEAALAEATAAEGVATSPLDRAMQAFLEAQTVPQSRAVVEQHAALLLSPQADEWLAQQLAFARADGETEVAAWLEEEREVLAALRARGIDAFFDHVEARMALIAGLPDLFRAAMAGAGSERQALISELRPMFKGLGHEDPLRPFLKEMISLLQRGAPADAAAYLARYEAQWGG